ncbi:MAG: hypothetical protein FWF15_05870 [Oscillospiraceae bacterium]|nr:hypothetical protein [Oscillospiraceae bacterium]
MEEKIIVGSGSEYPLNGIITIPEGRHTAKIRRSHEVTIRGFPEKIDRRN